MRTGLYSGDILQFAWEWENKNDVISQPKLEDGIPEHEAQVLST